MTHSSHYLGRQHEAKNTKILNEGVTDRPFNNVFKTVFKSSLLQQQISFFNEKITSSNK